MIQKLFSGVTAFVLLLSFQTIKAQTLSVIPAPVSVVQGNGTFSFSPSVKIIFDKDQSVNANYLNTYLAKYYMVRPLIQPNIKKYIALRLITSSDKTISSEEYFLRPLFPFYNYLPQ